MLALEIPCPMCGEMSDVHAYAMDVRARTGTLSVAVSLAGEHECALPDEDESEEED